MSPTYSYIFTELRSDTKLDVLPLYGVSCSDMLNKNGDFTGSIRLDNPTRDPQAILDATVPGKTGVWVERDGVLVWGGIIWSRTYQSAGRSLQLTGQTFSSYPAAVINEVDNTITQEPQNHIIDIWTYLQAKGDAYLIGITIPQKTSERGRTVLQTYTGDDQYNLQRYIDTMLGKDAEFRIRVFKDQYGQRNALLEVGIFDLNYPTDRLGSTDNEGNVVFQYPGDISEYYITQNSAKAATKGYGTGDPSGENKIYSTYVNPNTPANFIGIDFQKSYTFATTQATLDTQLHHDVNALTPPANSVTIHLAGDKVNMGEWALGDYATFVVDDPYAFPSGAARGSFRIAGWELHPASTDGVEALYLTLQNPDNLLSSQESS